MAFFEEAETSLWSVVALPVNGSIYFYSRHIQKIGEMSAQ
jgi:hypothetical protein